MPTCDRWKCPRNSLECINESDLDWVGWLVFAILTIAHTAGDIINGLKLLILCGKRRHDNGTRARFFIAGLCLTFVSTFTVYTSTVYNSAIARSNTDIIVNAVIILFVMDIDEYIYSAISAGSSFWRTKSANHQAQGGGNSGDGGDKKDDDSIDIDFGVPKSNSNGLISTTQGQAVLEPAQQSENQQLETSIMQLVEERIRQLERERLAQHSENQQLETRIMQLVEERIRQLERERSLTPTPQNSTPAEVFPSVDATSDTSNATV
ncbi:hypothetical protein ACHAWC_007672 [Mediolabrus comicus]